MNPRRLLWSAPFFLLALAVVFTGLSSDRAWPVAALLLAGIVIAVVPEDSWKELLGNVENAKFGPVSISLQRDAVKAAANAPEADTAEGPGAKPLDKAESMLELRVRLEWKLAYVAKHLLAENGNATFLTVGSLQYDGYLTENEAQTAIGILNTRQEELQELPERAQRLFLSEAGAFVDSVRASVFWGQTKRCLEGKERASDASILVGRLPSKGRRDDLLAGRPDRGIRVAPAFVLEVGSKILEGVIERLHEEGAAVEGSERQLIVIPDNSYEPEAAAAADRPRVVKLANLRSAVEGA
jgi:hypothetical protein